MRNLKKLSVLLLSAAMCVGLVGCGKKESSVKEDPNVLKVGMEAGYAPYNWTQKDDSNGAAPIQGSSEYAGGYDVMMAKKVADSLGKKLVVVKTDWQGLPPAVQSGKIDLIMAGMSPTAKRKQEVDFTSPYWVSDYVVIVKKDGKYANAKSINDFKGAKITGQLNTIHYDKIDEMPGVQKVEAMSDFPQMRVALQSGIIDGYIAEAPEGQSVTSVMPEFKVITFEPGNGFEIKDHENEIAAAVKKGSDLKEKVNQVFDKVSKEERLQMMQEAIKAQPVNN